MTEEEVKKAMHAAAVECGRKSFDEHDQAAWAASLNSSGMDLNQALAAIAKIGADPAFVERSYKYIGPGAVVVQHRRSREKRIRKAGLIPAPPDPDDARAAIAHQRAILEVVASGAAYPSDVDPTGVVQATQRRAEAIRRNRTPLGSGAGRPSQQTPSPESAPGRSRMLDRVRERCRQASEQIHSDSPDPTPAPTPTPASAPAPGKVRTQTDPAQAGDALRALFGIDNVPDWIDDIDHTGQNEVEWCGRCHSDDGTKIALNSQGEQVRVQCCTPQRVSV